jgi:predicted amidohydrolase YtcJ
MLDEVSTDRPVLVYESSFHQGTANSAALAAVGFGRDTPRWWGGELERDRRGEPTGVAWERAFSVIATRAERAEADAAGVWLLEQTGRVARERLSEGITHIGEAWRPGRRSIA